MHLLDLTIYHRLPSEDESDLCTDLRAAFAQPKTSNILRPSIKLTTELPSSLVHAKRMRSFLATGLRLCTRYVTFPLILWSHSSTRIIHLSHAYRLDNPVHRARAAVATDIVISSRGSAKGCKNG